MSNLLDVTAPCVIRLPSGEKYLMAEKFEHSEGLLYFDLWWHQSDPENAFHIIEGELVGDGPWKIADHVISVLGCQGSDPELAADSHRVVAIVGHEFFEDGVGLGDLLHR